MKKISVIIAMSKLCSWDMKFIALSDNAEK